MRMAIVAAADEQDEPDDEPADSMLGARFEGVLIIENVDTGDGRLFQDVTMRELPLPLMALDETTERHQQAVLAGSIEIADKVDAATLRDAGITLPDDAVDDEIEAWAIAGRWLTNDDGQRFEKLNRAGVLRWLSADMDEAEVELRVPAQDDVDFDDLPTDADGRTIVKLDAPVEVFTHVRVMGGTLLPFPAMQEATLWTLDDDESYRLFAGAVTAAAHPVVTAPAVPPSWMFRRPDVAAGVVMPHTVTDDGHVFGHLGVFGECHIGYVDECITPPRSATNYAHFLTGEIVTSDGDRFPVGQLTVNGDHADIRLDPMTARRHYDNTTLAAADVTMGEDEIGIWYSGALRPGLSAEQVRTVMAGVGSGDWRRIAGSMELVAALLVNVPGFNERPRIRAHLRDGLVASLIASIHTPITSMPARPGAAIEYIARSIGRDRTTRAAAAYNLVHGAR